MKIMARGKVRCREDFIREKQIEAGVAPEDISDELSGEILEQAGIAQIRQQESRIVRSLPDREMEQQHSKPANHRECRHFQMICFV